MIDALLALLEAAITEAPEILSDVEALIAKLKAASAGPIEPSIAAETAPLAQKLGI